MMQPKHWRDWPLTLNARGVHELMGGVARQLSGKPQIAPPKSTSAFDGASPALVLRKLWCTRAHPPEKMGLFRSRDWD